MKKQILIALVGLFLSGCASPYPSFMADSADPTRPALTPELRKVLAFAVILRNPDITFLEAHVSKPKVAGFYKTPWSSYEVCTRWRGLDKNGKEITNYTVSIFQDGRPRGSSEFSYDSCSFLASRADYQAFPELLDVQRNLTKVLTSDLVGKKKK